VTDETPEPKLLLRGRFTFGLKQAIAAALIGTTIAVVVAISNLT
jgi:hypothetical protein